MVYVGNPFVVDASPGEAKGLTTPGKGFGSCYTPNWCGFWLFKFNKYA